MLAGVVGVEAAALVGIVSALAAAETEQTITVVTPSPAEGAALTTDSVEFKFTYNKKPKATAVCVLSGPTPSSGACDAPVASGTKGSRSGKSYSGLANGSYTFTITLTLTDGGTASATRHFTVDVPAPRHVYWTNASTGTIGRANLDGTGANQSFITAPPTPSGWRSTPENDGKPRGTRW